MVENAVPTGGDVDVDRVSGTFSVAPEAQALDRALRFLEYRPRTRAEVRDRLKRWGYRPQTVDGVVGYLESVALLDDKGFSRLFMDQLVAKGYGERRIREKLLQKGLERRLVDETLALYPRERDLERAVNACEPRLKRALKEEPRAAARRLSQYLLRRGYPPEVAREASRRLSQVDTDYEQ